jgi:hypothetical protein
MLDECASKDWLVRTPEDDAQYLYFVGTSSKRATEQEARNDAQVDATDKFVRYTGVKVAIFDEYLQTAEGKASQVIDPNISERRRQEIRAEAFVSRIKATEWCRVRYEQRRGDTVLGGFFTAGVLVRVPKDELARVQAYVANLERERGEKLDSERSRHLAEAKQHYDAALLNEKEGLVLPALSSLQAARGKLQQAASVAAAPKPGEDAPSVAEIAAAEQRITARLEMKTLPGGRADVEPGEVPGPFQVRLSLSQPGGAVPVAGVPIVFQGNGQPAGNARTDANGQAALTMGAIAAEGQLLFAARVDGAALPDSISPEARAALASPRAELMVRVRQLSLEERAHVIVRALKQQMDSKLGQNRFSITMGNLTYAETNTAGIFIDRFRPMLESALIQDTGWDVRKPAQRTLTRGFKDVPSDSPAALAQAAEAQAVLSGRYFEADKSVVVNAELLSDRNVLLASTSTRIANVPAGWDLKPANVNQSVATAQTLSAAPGAGAKDFQLDLWIDRGNGGIYKEGDDLIVSVSASEDCYLKLVYVDAENNRIVVFPNAFAPDTRIRKGQVQVIPPPGASFRFRVKGPFGAETLVAFASTQPFAPDPGKQIGNGMVLLDDPLDAIARRSRGIGVEGVPARRAEKRATLTTVAK